MKKYKEKQYLVIGLGRFGSAVARTLVEEGMEVLGIDQEMSVVEAHRSLLTETMCMDSMDPILLGQIGVQNFDAVIVSIGADIRAGGTITMMLKEMGAKWIVAKAYDEFNGRMLTRLGADKVVFPERDMAQRLAHNMVSDRILDFLEISEDFNMQEMFPKPEWVGKTLRELNLRAKEGINIVAIRSEGMMNAMPAPDTILHEQDRILAVMKT